jgi:hypothetical protein
MEMTERIKQIKCDGTRKRKRQAVRNEVGEIAEEVKEEVLAATLFGTKVRNCILGTIWIETGATSFLWRVMCRSVRVKLIGCLMKVKPGFT